MLMNSDGLTKREALPVSPDGGDVEVIVFVQQSHESLLSRPCLTEADGRHFIVMCVGTQLLPSQCIKQEYNYTHTHTQTDRQTHTQTDRQSDTHTDRQTDRHTYRQTDSQTDGQTDRQSDRQTDSQTDRQTYRDRLD